MKDGRYLRFDICRFRGFGGRLTFYVQSAYANEIVIHSCVRGHAFKSEVDARIHSHDCIGVIGLEVVRVQILVKGQRLRFRARTQFMYQYQSKRVFNDSTKCFVFEPF